MDKINNQRTAVILYFGVGIQTTPKIQLIRETLEKKYENVVIAGVTATPYEPGSKHKVLAITTKSKPLKVIHSISAIVRLCAWIKKESPDLIYAVNPIPGLIATAFKKTKNIKFIYETLELFCGIDYFPYNKKYRHIWYIIEKLAIQNSETTFTTDEFRVKFLRRYFNLPNKAITYTYNTNKISHQIFEDKTENKDTLSYCGGVYPGRQIEEIIKAFSLIKKVKPEANLVIAGGGNPQYIKELGLLASELFIADSVTFTGQLPNDQLKAIMRNSSITFAFYKRDSLNNRLNSPNKIFDSIFCRTSLITTSSPLARRVILANQAGEVVSDTTPEVISVKCLELMSPQKAKPDFDRLIEKYSWDSEEKKILSTLP